MLKPQEYTVEQRSELLGALLENQGFKLLQSIKLTQYAAVSRKVLTGQCKDMIEYVKDTSLLKALMVDEQTIDQAVRKHPHGDGSEQSTVVGGDSVNSK